MFKTVGVIGTLISLAFVAALVFLVLSFMNFGDEAAKVLEKYENSIGTAVIFKGDTLMVTDYSFIDSNLILEDGRTIHMKLFEKLEKID
jgi:amino acid permease